MKQQEIWQSDGPHTHTHSIRLYALNSGSHSTCETQHPQPNNRYSNVLQKTFLGAKFHNFLHKKKNCAIIMSAWSTVMSPALVFMCCREGCSVQTRLVHRMVYSALL